VFPEVPDVGEREFEANGVGVEVRQVSLPCDVTGVTVLVVAVVMVAVGRFHSYNIKKRY
jgi:hypothetical protein